MDNLGVLKSFQIVSLLDMRQFFAGVYGNAFDLVRGQFSKVLRLYAERGPGGKLTSKEAEELNILLGLFHFECERHKFERPLGRFYKLRILEKNPEALDLETIKWSLKELLDGALQEGYHKKFFVVDEDAAKHFNLKHPFGEAVYLAFESARKDSREAKNCQVLDRHTACVFHLTRVLEAGLKALAGHVGASFADINSENWETIINGIEGEIKRIRQNPKSTHKASELEFYSGAAQQFRYFKEHWRNPTDHYRATYDGPQAESALGHVEEFMRHITARGIKE